MRELGLDELKKLELGILKHIHKVCEENKLDYSLAYGTLLGAIRHKGFIPWDDDIDIMMPRDSYLKLYQILQNGTRYKMLTDENQKYCYPWGKVVDTNTTLVEHALLENIEDYGVYVDVFPIDGMGKSRFSIMKLFFEIYICNMLRISAACGGFDVRQHKIFYSIINRIALKKDGRYWSQKLGKISQKYICSKNRYVHILEGEPVVPYKLKKLYKNFLREEEMKEIIEIEFEKSKFKCVKCWDSLLTKWYGEYMKLPPKSERIVKHDFTAWLKNSKTW